MEALASGSVRVTVRHSEWPEQSTSLNAHSKTWAGILTELKRVVETGDISGRRKARYALMRAFMWAMPAKTRTENVDVP